MLKTQKRKVEGANLSHTGHCKHLKNVVYLISVVTGVAILVCNLKVFLKVLPYGLNWYRAQSSKSFGTWIRYTFLNLLVKSDDAWGDKVQGVSFHYSSLQCITPT